MGYITAYSKIVGLLPLFGLSVYFGKWRSQPDKKLQGQLQIFVLKAKWGLNSLHNKNTVNDPVVPDDMKSQCDAYRQL